MEQLNISMAIFHSYFSHYQRVNYGHIWTASVGDHEPNMVENQRLGGETPTESAYFQHGLPSGNE